MAIHETERGYIDNRLTIVIALILAAVALSSYLEQSTGRGLSDLLGDLPPLALWFLSTASVVGIGGIFAVRILAVATLGEPSFPVTDRDGMPTIVRRDAVAATGGGYLVVMGLLFTGFGLAGSGWPWGAIAIAGLLAIAAGVIQLGRTQRWQLRVDGILQERCTYGRASPVAEWHWPIDTRPTFELDEQTSGGAFGKPLVERHAVVLDGRELFDSWDRDLARAFLHALQAHYDAGPGDDA